MIRKSFICKLAFYLSLAIYAVPLAFILFINFVVFILDHIDGESSGNILREEPRLLYVPLATILCYASYCCLGSRYLKRGLERRLWILIPLPLIPLCLYAVALTKFNK